MKTIIFLPGFGVCKILKFIIYRTFPSCPVKAVAATNIAVELAIVFLSAFVYVLSDFSKIVGVLPARILFDSMEYSWPTRLERTDVMILFMMLRSTISTPQNVFLKFYYTPDFTEEEGRRRNETGQTLVTKTINIE